MKRYDIILFDADGTLYDFETSEARAVSEVLEMCGLPTDPETVGLYHRINDAEWKALERGETTRERLKVERFEKLLAALAEKNVYGSESAETMCGLYVERLSRQCILFPESEPVCAALSPRADLYIITNGITNVQRGRFARSPITKYFRDIFISEAMGAVKPERRYFELVLASVGITEAEAKERVLVVGDSLSSDIKGAVDFGLDSCWFAPKGGEPVGITPTYTIRSLYELCGIVMPGTVAEGELGQGTRTVISE